MIIDGSDNDFKPTQQGAGADSAPLPDNIRLKKLQYKCGQKYIDFQHTWPCFLIDYFTIMYSACMHLDDDVSRSMKSKMWRKK